MDGYRQRRETHGGECCWDGLRCLDILLIFVCLFCYRLLFPSFARARIHTFFLFLDVHKQNVVLGGSAWGER